NSLSSKRTSRSGNGLAVLLPVCAWASELEESVRPPNHALTVPTPSDFNASRRSITCILLVDADCYCNCTTATDFGGSLTTTALPSRFALNVVGLTFSGSSTVLRASICLAVSKRPEALFACAPRRFVRTTASRLGSRFASPNLLFPPPSRAALPLTAGTLTAPCVYRGVLTSVGRNVAPWNGRYMWKT